MRPQRSQSRWCFLAKRLIVMISNGLSEDLGKLGCIETEEISGTPPKLSDLTRLASAATTTV
jgi:hypothetical protein